MPITCHMVSLDGDGFCPSHVVKYYSWILAILSQAKYQRKHLLDGANYGQTAASVAFIISAMQEMSMWVTKPHSDSDLVSYAGDG